MILRRPDSSKVLGVMIHANMEINTIKQKMESALAAKPELASEFSGSMQLLQAAKVLDDNAGVLMEQINEGKATITDAKRTLELAQKVLNLNVKVEMGKMDVKPMVQGSPIGLGVAAAITPFQTAVDTATEALNTAEDELKDMTEDLMALTEEVKEKGKEAKDSIMLKITQLGNSIIEV